MKLIIDLTERALAQMMGMSPGYAHKLIRKQDSKQIGKQIGKQIKGVKSVEIINLDTFVGSKQEANRKQTGSNEERKVDKEIPMVFPTTPSLTKEINKERGLELEIFPPTSEISPSNSSESDDALESSVETIGNDRIDYDAFIKAFNSQIAGTHIPRLTNIQGQRRAMMRARIREYGKEAFWKACLNMRDSEWMKGRPNCSTFTWLIKPNNFPKVLEGDYNR